MNDFHVDEHPVVFLKPRLSYPYAWVGHIPFAYLLIDLLRPRTLVELGTDSGNSYLAFCQAVAELGTGTRCTAIDSWEGDPHARRYGESVLETLKRYHNPRYASFSTLYRSYFIDALDEFADGSVDLLHIDGLHTYEAVSEDFNTWLPKLSDRAVVIFHDTQVKERGFGVGRFLEELRDKYRVAEFVHSNGLGIALVGRNTPQPFLEFMSALEARGESLRRFFSELGESLIAGSHGGTGARSEQVNPDITCRVYYRNAADEFDNARSSMAELTDPHGQQELEISFPSGVRPDFIRIDPADHPGLFEISAVRLVSADTRVSATDLASRVRGVNGELVEAALPGHLRLVAFSDDPYVELYVGDLMEGLSADGALNCMLTLDYQVVVNIPSLWPMASAQEGALRQARERLQDELAIARSLPVAASAGASLADIATTIGAMHVAGVVFVPGAGPSLYLRSSDSAYSHERRLLGHIIGLAEAAEIRFDVASGDEVSFVRVDIPAMPGTYRFTCLIVDGVEMSLFPRRVIPVQGQISNSGADDVVIFSAHAAPSFELDLSDVGVSNHVRIRVAREEREPWSESYANRIVQQVDARLVELEEARGTDVAGTSSQVAAAHARIEAVYAQIEKLQRDHDGRITTRLARRLRGMLGRN